MDCPSCDEENVPDRRFCNWCGQFLADGSAGTIANLVKRAFANILDFILPIFAVLVIFGIGQSGGFMTTLAVLFFLAWAVASFWLFKQGMTPGKYVSGLRVVEERKYEDPGFMRMLARETVGKWVSGFFFGLGFFWAIFDDDSQTWHDKIVNTVVVNRV